MKKSLIPKFVDQFFKSCDIDEKLNRYSLFLIRQDGVILYHNKNSANTLSESSVGALLAGVWQAASALTSFMPKSQESTTEIFRFSFDTADSGVYVVPVQVYSDEFYLGIIYYNETNPGAIKNKIRLVASSFTSFMETELKDHPMASQPPKKKKEYLFNDLSDHEIDSAFAAISL